MGLAPLFIVLLLRRKVTLKRKTLDCSQSIVSSLGCPESYSTQLYRAWGGDLIVFVGPGVGHLTDLALPGEGIFESFFARRGDI